MSYIKDVLSLDQRHLSLAVAFFGATVAPGVLILFHFKPDLMNEWDFLKIFLFSLSLTTPLVLLHYIQMRSYGLLTKDGLSDNAGAATLACLTSLLSLNFALLGAYVLGWSFREFVLGATAMTVMCYVVGWWTTRADRKAARLKSDRP